MWGRKSQELKRHVEALRKENSHLQTRLELVEQRIKALREQSSAFSVTKQALEATIKVQVVEAALAAVIGRLASEYSEGTDGIDHVDRFLSLTRKLVDAETFDMDGRNETRVEALRSLRRLCILSTANKAGQK